MTQLLEIISDQIPISASSLERAIRLHREERVPLAEILVREGVVEENDIFFLISRRTGASAVPEERLLHLRLTQELRRRVPRRFARSCSLVPLDLDVDKGILSVALLDPTDLEILDRLKEVSRVSDIRAYLARRSAIREAILVAYSSEEVDDTEETPMPPLLPVVRVPEPLEATPTPPLVGLEPKPSTQPSPASDDDEAKVELDPALEREIAELGGSIRYGRARHGGRDAPESPAPEPRPAADPPARPSVLLSSRTGPTRMPRARLDDDTTTPPFDSPRVPRLMRPTPAVQKQPSKKPDSAVGGHDDEGLVLRDLRPASLVHEREEELERTTPNLMKNLELTPLPDVQQMIDLDALLRELLPAVGILVSMLEERIDPSSESYREFGRLSRLVAREAGLDEFTVARVSLAAHLFGLDLALRREVGLAPSASVTLAFSGRPSTPGGLSPSLRALGARALGIPEGSRSRSQGTALVQLVADYLELRAESEDAPDLETVAQLFRTSGHDPELIEALVRSIESAERTPVLPDRLEDT
jgi:hypothetical protein